MGLRTVKPERFKYLSVLDSTVSTLPTPDVAYVYARVSIEDQSKYSIEDQVQWGKDTSTQRGWKYGGAYTDNGGHSDEINRPRLMDMLHDVARGKVRRILIKYNDRLARGDNLKKLLEWLRAWGVKVYVGDLPEHHDDATGVLLAALGSYGELFLRNLRKKTKEGLVRAKKAGKKTGRPVAGFKWESGKLVPESWALELYNEALNYPLLQVVKSGQFTWLSGKRKGQPLSYDAASTVVKNIELYNDGELLDDLQKRSARSKEKYNDVRTRRLAEEREFEKWLLNNKPLRSERTSL